MTIQARLRMRPLSSRRNWCTVAAWRPAMRFPLRLFAPLPAPLFERPSPGRIPERRLSRAGGRNDYLMIRLRSSVDNDAATLFQLLHRRNRLRLIFRAVARDVAHELLSDGYSTDASKADS